MTDQEKVREFLSRATHMVICVVLPDGLPWAVPVKIQSQNGSEFEWVSMPNTEHSKALVHNEKMSVVIFDTKKDDQIGVYMSGRGEVVQKNGQGESRYRFTADSMWLNDETYIKREVTL